MCFTATTSQPQHLVSRSGQHQEQGFTVEVAERIAAPQRTIYKSSGPYLRNGAEKIRWTSPLPLWKKSQIGSLRPLTVTGRPLLTPCAQLGTILSSSDLNRLLFLFSQGSSLSSRNLPKWTLFCRAYWAHTSTLWRCERHSPQTSSLKLLSC